MKTIKINSDRRLSQAYLFIGYLDENNAETIKFEIPEEYQEYSKMACFKTKDGTFTKLFDDIETNYLTLTSDITRYNEADLSITFVDSANSIVARTSILHLIIEDTIIDNGDVKKDEPKVVILNELIDKVSNVNVDLEDNILTITRADGTTKSLNVKGDKGEQGIQGIQGIKGDKGDTGSAGINGTNGTNGIDGKNATINGLNAINLVNGDNIEISQNGNEFTIKAIIPEDVSPIILDETKIKELNDLTHLLGDNQVFCGSLYSQYGDGIFYVNSKFFLNSSSENDITDEHDYIDVGSSIIVSNMGKSILAFTTSWYHTIKYYRCINTYGGKSARYNLTTLTTDELYSLIENSKNMLTTNNTTAYSVLTDYQPTTKKYVDEKVKADRGIFYAEIFEMKWYSKENLQPILDLAYKGGFSDVLIRANSMGRFMTVSGMNLQTLSANATTDITFGALSNLVGNYMLPTQISYGYVYANKVGLDSNGNVVINGTTGMQLGSVDLQRDVTSIAGYDSTKTQTLKNVKGTLKWE